MILHLIFLILSFCSKFCTDLGQPLDHRNWIKLEGLVNSWKSHFWEHNYSMIVRFEWSNEKLSTDFLSRYWVSTASAHNNEWLNSRKLSSVNDFPPQNILSGNSKQFFLKRAKTNIIMWSFILSKTWTLNAIEPSHRWKIGKLFSYTTI